MNRSEAIRTSTYVYAYMCLTCGRSAQLRRAASPDGQAQRVEPGRAALLLASVAQPLPYRRADSGRHQRRFCGGPGQAHGLTRDGDFGPAGPGRTGVDPRHAPRASVLTSSDGWYVEEGAEGGNRAACSRRSWARAERVGGTGGSSRFQGPRDPSTPRIVPQPTAIHAPAEDPGSAAALFV